MRHTKLVPALFAALVLAGCGGDDMFDETGGIRVTRSACPAVAVPAYTGDVTLFDPPASRDASAIDVVATITNVQGACSEGTEAMTANANFEVTARRNSGVGARQVVIPYFATVVRGGSKIVSKQIGQVALNFADGEIRASTRASATANVDRSAVTLPEETVKRINRKRKPGDADASIDPLADPAIRAAVSNANFELLVGFQLTQEQLAYNATR